MRRRLFSILALGAAVATGITVYAAISDASAPTAAPRSTVTPPPPSIPPEARRAVELASGVPGSPVTPDAVQFISHIYTPANRQLPSFFGVPTRDGGACLVTSTGVVAGCSRGVLNRHSPGTLTIADDSEADMKPPFVYGQAAGLVVGVDVEIGGKQYPAAVRNRFYLLELPSLALSNEDVTAVTFRLADGASKTVKTGR
jgi:hypothetical protein